MLRFININKKFLILGMVLGLIVLTTSTAVAAGEDKREQNERYNGGIRLIKLMQQASFWIGIAVSIWGIVEWQLDFPGWRSRVLSGLLGYIAILIIPLVFLELKRSLQVDVWYHIRETTGW